MPRTTELVDHVPFDRTHTFSLRGDLPYRAICVDACTRGRCGRDVGNEHALLGIEWTAKQAEPTGRAVLAIVVSNQAVIPELLTTRADLVVQRVHFMWLDRLHSEH